MVKAPERKTARGVILDLLAQFPDAPALTLAKKAYREHPGLWSNLETCRTAVRRYLGTSGKESRAAMKETKFYREPRKAGWTGVIPEAVEQIDNWGIIQIDGPLRTLVLSDIHLPYHSPQALELALQYGLDQKANFILLNGDIIDSYMLSRFEKDPGMRHFPEEVLAAKFFLAGLRKRFPKARILYRHGNHEERYEAYMRWKCPELLGIANFEWAEVFALKDYGVELIKGKRPIRLGKLTTLHGHEYTFAISNPVSAARGLFLRAKEHSICGHFHRASSHSDKTVNGKVLSTWSLGCLCNLNPAYSPINSWEHGFAFVDVAKDGAFNVANFKIIEGRVYHA